MELLVAKMFALGATVASQSGDFCDIWLDPPDLAELHNLPTHLSTKLGKVVGYTVEKNRFIYRHSVFLNSWYYSKFGNGFDLKYYCDDKEFTKFTDLSMYIITKNNK